MAQRPAVTTLRYVLIVSAASGLMWAAVGLTLASFVSVAMRGSWPPVAILWWYMGGIVLAPAIGVLAAVPAQWFRRLPPLGRAALAGLVLYVATFLFLLASSAYINLGRGRSLPSIVSDAGGVAFAFLFFTGAFILLWPLAYWNLALVGKLWTAR